MADETDKSAKPKARRPGASRAALVLMALAISVSAQPQTITGKVVGVSDGHTITVLDSSNRQHKVRLDGIDAPESSQDFGSRAKQSLSDLVFGKTVTVTSRKNDRYGRILGKVTLDGKDINQEQINRGMAWFNSPYEGELPANVAGAYMATQTLARHKKRGLWAEASPIPPWDFRRGKTPGATPTGAIIGNRNSKIYHLPNCPDYSKVSERNRVTFETDAEAQGAGYRKARNCPQ
jgi:endonuclease YncB( thermonuclease family)